MHACSIMYVYMYFLRNYNHEFEREQGGAWDIAGERKEEKNDEVAFNFILYKIYITFILYKIKIKNKEF